MTEQITKPLPAPPKAVDKPIAGERYMLQSDTHIIAYLTQEKQTVFPHSSVGVLPSGTVVEAGNTTQVDGQEWVNVKHRSLRGNQGWIKRAGVTFLEATAPKATAEVVEVPAVRPAPTRAKPAQVETVADNRKLLMLEQLKIIRGAIDALITLAEMEVVKA